MSYGPAFGAASAARERVYVEVVVVMRPDGSMQPVELRWSDGTQYPVRALAFGRRAMSANGEYGLKYSIEIKGRRRELWLDVADGRWFVETDPEAKSQHASEGRDPRYGDDPS